MKNGFVIVSKILLIILIINIILAFLVLYPTKTILNVTDKNRDMVNLFLSEMISFRKGEAGRIQDIKKVGIGNGRFGKYNIFIYDISGDVQELKIYEGDTEEAIAEIREYVRENGYNLENIVLLMIGICIIFVVCRKKKKILSHFF